jgi:hypothetical protein
MVCVSRKHLPAAVLVSMGCSVAAGMRHGPYRANDVLKVSDAARETVDPRNHQNVTGP